VSEPNIRQLAEIEANERWLAQMPDLRASDKAIEAAKLAARRELSASSSMPARRTWRAWTGSLAAAAAIALATTVGWRSFRVEPAAPMTQNPIASVASAGTSTQVTQLDEQLESLEDWSADASWEANGADLYEAFKEVMQDDTNSHNGTM
jgi:negative regulator of sigma E activity